MTKSMYPSSPELHRAHLVEVKLEEAIPLLGRPLSGICSRVCSIESEICIVKVVRQCQHRVSKVVPIGRVCKGVTDEIPRAPLPIHQVLIQYTGRYVLTIYFLHVVLIENLVS